MVVSTVFIKNECIYLYSNKYFVVLWNLLHVIGLSLPNEKSDVTKKQNKVLQIAEITI